MSYTIEIKKEISEIKGTNSEMIAELSGFIRNNAYLNNNTLYLTTENEFTIERLTSFFKKLYEVELNVEVKDNLNFNKKNLYLLSTNSKVDLILKDIGYYDNNNNYLETPPTYIVGANEEIRAYLRGTFLCTGSINNPKTSRYHMELLISKPNEAVFIQKLLNIFDLNAKILNREKGYMIYIKEAEKISDYIRILGANRAVLFFEDARIYREKKNQTNRLNNCEQANMDKVFLTAEKQLEQIKIIEESDSYELLDDRTKQAFDYRKKYPESSLKELSEIITLETGKSITKSGLNHRFRKIKELAEQLEKIKQRENKN
ncbi:putative sporulation transcription regulator WhiA [Mycoplasma sp. CAG:877]|nr:putative sporulation transcription regulator WhiA [Mycoplasma sp. CAG:877]